MGALGHAERVCKRLQAEQDCKPLQAKRVCKPDQPWLAGRYASLIELIIVKAAGWQSNYVSQAFPGCDNLFLVCLLLLLTAAWLSLATFAMWGRVIRAGSTLVM